MAYIPRAISDILKSRVKKQQMYIDCRGKTGGKIHTGKAGIP